VFYETPNHDDTLCIIVVTCVIDTRHERLSDGLTRIGYAVDEEIDFERKLENPKRER